MELKDFIPHIISNIAEGIRKTIKDKNVVDPQTIGRGYDGPHMAQSLDLDITFQVEQVSSNDANGKITIFKVASIGIGGTDSHAQTEFQHIHLSIPIDLPIIKLQLKESDKNDTNK